jgi:hypothetical protein
MPKKPTPEEIAFAREMAADQAKMEAAEAARQRQNQAADVAAQAVADRKAIEAARQQKMDAQQQAAPATAPTTRNTMGQPFKKGGSVKSSASKRGDGIAQRGKTRGRMV